MHIFKRCILVAGTLIFISCSCSNSTEPADTSLAEENARLQLKLDSLRLRLDSLTNQQDYTQDARGGKDLLSESDIAFFKRKGVANPVEIIKTDLIKNNQLIPVEGNLGGTMQFYKEGIQILNRQWVLAYFEDGHSAGELLLEYTFTDTGDISWKVLSSRVL
jgi:regulator of replication initiation timing